MDSLPVELWREIVQRLHNQDLLAFSRTSPLARIVAQEALFEEVVLGTSNNALLLESDVKRLALFARTITERPEFACHVRRLTVHRRGAIGPLAAPHPIIDTLDSFSKLQMLQIRGFFIDYKLYSTLYSLPNLKSITYDLCVFESMLRYIPVKAISPRVLSHVSIRDPVSADVWAMAVPAKLASFSIRAPALHSSQIISDLVKRGENNILTSLDVTYSIPGNIVPFLLCLPGLRRISLPPDIHGVLNLLPTNAIPLLEHFKGYAEYAGAFIRGRPIHTVEITMNSDTPVDIITVLRHSTVPVTNLTIKMADVSLQVVQHAPVALRRLVVIVIGPPADLLWLPALSKLPELRLLHISTGPTFTTEEQDVVVNYVSSTCKTVEKIVFEPGIYHAQGPVVCNRQKGNAWEFRAER